MRSSRYWAAASRFQPGPAAAVCAATPAVAPRSIAMTAEVATPALATALEELHRPFMALGLRAGLERPEIAPSPGLRVLLPRVQPVTKIGRASCRERV